ncbi:hypothetical protein [Kitasatospora indigofera]
MVGVGEGDLPQRSEERLDWTLVSVDPADARTQGLAWWTNPRSRPG